MHGRIGTAHCVAIVASQGEQVNMGCEFIDNFSAFYVLKCDSTGRCFRIFALFSAVKGMLSIPVLYSDVSILRLQVWSAYIHI
jgi:hypothetical protein